jgi:hypothetical protein
MSSSVLELTFITVLRFITFSLDWSFLSITKIIFPQVIFVQIVKTLISHLRTKLIEEILNF